MQHGRRTLYSALLGHAGKECCSEECCTQSATTAQGPSCAVLVQERREGSASAVQDQQAPQMQAPLQEDETTGSLDGWNRVVSTRQGLLSPPVVNPMSGPSTWRMYVE